jgi:hypothetical protein
MYRRVRIKKLPQARTGYQVQGALVNDVPAMGGADYNAYIGEPALKESKYIKAVPRDEANLEAEGGETVYGDINGDGMPEHKIITGPRHAQGGVPLNLPEDTFIFSDTRAMRIKDPQILTMFGKGGTNKSYTPAEIAKQYDVQKYRKILEDPNTDAIERKTAELMIKKFVVKLGCLALTQESMKGFPQGIPAVAKPCMEARGLTEEDILPSKEISVLNDQLKKQMEQQQGGGDENALEEAVGMNQGQPVAEPQPMSAPQQQMPSPEEMMMYGGGYRRLKKAQQGMEQQGGMEEIVQEVSSALQRGADPSQVVMSLLENNIPPDAIVQIFAQLGASPEEASGLVQQVMSQGQGGQEQMMAEQQPMSEEEAMMMQQQQMQQQAPPMAQYGMSMGGYDMPFFDIPQAEYGMSMGAGMSQNYQGRPKRIPGSGPITAMVKAQDGIEVKRGDYATEQEFQNALRRAYVQSQRGKQKIYVVKPDGTKVEQKVSATGHDTYSGADLDKWNGNQVAAATYEAMSQTFNDPKAKAAFAKQVKATLADKESYKGKTKYNADGTPKPAKYSATYQQQFGQDPATLSDDDIVKNYLRMQERNLKTTTYGQKIFGDPNLPYGSWMYKDGTGDIRAYESTGDAKGDKRGFKDVVKEANPNLTDAQIQEMYKKINSSGFTSLEKVSADMGLPMTRIAGSGKASNPYDKEAYLQQAGFIAADKLMKDIDANPGNYDEDTQTALLGITSFAGFNPYGKQTGYSDETGMGVTNISPIDAYYTNTTQDEKQAHHGLKFEDIPGDTPGGECQCEREKLADGSPDPTYKPKDAQGNCTCQPPQPKKCPCQKSDGTVIEMTANADGTCPPCEEDMDIDIPGPPAEWWLQDTIKTTGAFGDLMGAKKYMPWSPFAKLQTPRPVFKDPTRELAANDEQAKIQTEAMAQFAGPQFTSSRGTSTQGKSASNAANILASYNNFNVPIADQFEMKATDIRNQESMLNQGIAKQLYDANTIASQQFDNTKLALKNNFRNYYTGAITSKYKTDALNQMFENYRVSPAVGGEMGFKGSQRKPSPTTGGDSGFANKQEAFKWCKDNGDPNPSACAQRMMQGNTNTPNTADANMVNTMYGAYGGQMMEDGGYVYVNSWLPFIM